MEKENKSPVELLYRTIDSLPSGKLPYPELEISIRPYTWAEQKALAHVEKFQDFIPIVANGVASNIPVSSLTEGDFVWVALLRKLQSDGDASFSATTVCPNCGEKITKTFKLADLDFEEMGAKKLPIVLRGKDGLELEFSPPTILETAKELDKKSKEANKRLVAKCIKNKNYNEALDIVENADMVLGEYFDTIVKLMYHSVKPLDISCGNCGEETKVALEPFGRSVILAPFHDEKSDAEYSIRFGD